jgi:hypothetical protein
MFEGSGWVDRYLRDGWRKSYAQFLLQREETRNLPRFDGYSKKDGPFNLGMLRQLLGVTEAQQRTIDHDELDQPMPTGMVLDRLPRFPTPSGVLNQLAPSSKRRMLERLYPEYVRLCSFAHGLPDATLFKTMLNKDSRFRGLFSEASLRDMSQRDVAERSFIISVISIVQSTAELTTHYSTNVDLVAAVVQAWKDLSDGALLGRAIWNIRARALLGVIP